MTDTRTDTSVIVCTYDPARLGMLMDCLDSLAKQVQPPTEVIVVVDGSAELASTLDELEPSLHVVPLEKNVGLSAARNAGIARVTTEWVAFLDDDAVAEPEWLSRLQDAVRMPGEPVGSGGWSAPLYDAVPPKWFPPELLWTVGCSYRGLPTTRAVVRNLFGGCALLNTGLLRRHDGFEISVGRTGNDGHGGEEAEFCLRVTENEPSAVFVHEPSAVIHHHVPAERLRLSYVLRRCYSEGASKGQVFQMRGPGALSSESGFVRRAPAAALNYAIRGNPGAAGVLIAGVLLAGWGFLRSLLSTRLQVFPSMSGSSTSR